MPSPIEPQVAPGTVLHIKRYTSRGHPPKDKYLLLIGYGSENIALGFLISSQLSYLKQKTHKNEVVRIPFNATSFLRSESIIQCFELEHLQADAINAGIEDGDISVCGRLPTKYLHRVRDAVSESYLLAQKDIEEALRVLPPRLAS